MECMDSSPLSEKIWAGADIFKTKNQSIQREEKTDWYSEFMYNLFEFILNTSYNHFLLLFKNFYIFFKL